MNRTYGNATLTTRDGPFAGYMIRASNVLCPDGKRRNAFPSHDGIADTFFSIPAFVYATTPERLRTYRVYGYITFADQESDIHFVPYTYRKNHALVEHPKLEGEDLCLNCGRLTRIVLTTSGSALRHRVHDDTGEFLCDVEAARASNWDDINDAAKRSHAEVRPSDAYQERTSDVS